MADAKAEKADKTGAAELEGGAYEIIQRRLQTHGEELRKRLTALNEDRHGVFGAVEPALVATERITTQNNCVPRDMVAIGKNRFLFGYNVHIGLKSQIDLADVFAVYDYDPENHTFHPAGLESLTGGDFEHDFVYLYKYYKQAVFVKFMVIGPHLHIAFRIGREVDDLKTFKWVLNENQFEYVGNRFDHEYKFPPQQEFTWKRAHRDMQRHGDHPHVSIEDRVFVETVGGDLTVKIEDNTDSGEGIYREEVDNADQTLDDAEILYAIVGSLILIKILPYQEKDYRYLVYNEKIQRVFSVPAINDSCVLLPDDHGIVFANGYLLQIGELKLFDSDLTDMRFERRIASANGEDTLFVFYNRISGDYVLLSYNLIAQTVETPIACSGFTIFENGELIYFKTEDQPQKHHVLQIWKTPYISEAIAVTQSEKTDSYLYKVGNADLVRCMAECREILTLLGKEDTFADLYIDLVKRTGDLIDSYFWIGREETQNLKEPLQQLNRAAQSAIGEFEKVQRLRKSTEEETSRVESKATELIRTSERTRPDDIMGFVHILGELRQVRGEIISLRDLRYVDSDRVEGLEQEVQNATDTVSYRCVEFLESDEALDLYRKQVTDQEARIAGIEKVVEADEIGEALTAAGSELDMLIEIIGNLKIEDATKTTEIIDDISTIYARLNQVKQALKNRRNELARVEGVAQFNAQLKLLNQAVVNYLDLCSTPDKCDEYLTKTMVQLEELEGQFSEFEEYIEQLGEKRDEVYNAFESRKLSLTEARNKRAGALFKSGERILNGIRHRVSQFNSINEINGYLASDLMADKLRDLIEELKDLGDSVKADDLQTQLKTVHDEAVRQLKDKQELFVGGANVIQFGKHHFNVNTQELELTIVPRDDEMCFHLTGTKFFEPIKDQAFLDTEDVWEQSVVSENHEVYRAEYLAYQYFKENTEEDGEAGVEEMRKFMGPRYAESYTKGVHDHDAVAIVNPALAIHRKIGLLRFGTRARALGLLAWEALEDSDAKAILYAKLLAYGGMRKAFKQDGAQDSYVAELVELVKAFGGGDGGVLAEEAGEYLFYELSDPANFAVSREAAVLHDRFLKALSAKRSKKRFEESLKPLEHDCRARFHVILDWMRGFVAGAEDEEVNMEFTEEAAVHLLRGGFGKADVVDVEASVEIKGMKGSHPVIGENGVYRFSYNRFMDKLRRYEANEVKRFELYAKLKSELLEAKREEMRVDGFKPEVMSAFVRNRLLDKVYLPLIGANLAKQIGTAGADTRTDRMGMLLLISPPGYGKTTLMEYVANRLGITFMKINGPAIGHHVTSLDPMEAPNASAREEVDKLNLALEMGDNVLIYLDDIQHCNPEFLQKFISLCDAQRKMEGVWKGKARTYDLRGRKVAVVMAGNPYTESGGKFQIPDMLANRADTYNLGDIIGSHAGNFKASYIENALTSNPILSKLGTRGQKDVYAMMQIAETGSREGVDFEGNYSLEEIDEIASVLKKLFRVRDTILRVNQEYIRSAAMQDEYRTEPAFRLQGSYRNMNRIAERVMALMTDEEVEELIVDHYENEAQNLTTGAEANLLKFREMEGLLSEEESARWDEIKATFRRNQLMGAGGDDAVGRIVGQLAAFGKGLEDIQKALTLAAKPDLADATVEKIAEIIKDLRAVPVDVEIKVLPVQEGGGSGEKPEEMPVEVKPKVKQGARRRKK